MVVCRVRVWTMGQLVGLVLTLSVWVLRILYARRTKRMRNDFCIVCVYCAQYFISYSWARWERGRRVNTDRDFFERFSLGSWNSCFTTTETFCRPAKTRERKSIMHEDAIQCDCGSAFSRSRSLSSRSVICGQQNTLFAHFMCHIIEYVWPWYGGNLCHLISTRERKKPKAEMSILTERNEMKLNFYSHLISSGFLLLFRGWKVPKENSLILSACVCVWSLMLPPPPQPLPRCLFQLCLSSTICLFHSLAGAHQDSYRWAGVCYKLCTWLFSFRLKTIPLTKHTI